MGAWAILVNILFPLPLVALLLLCLPLPNAIATPVRTTVNGLLNKILFTPLISGFNLYQLCSILSIFLFLESTYSTVKESNRVEAAESMVAKDRFRCWKWRAERNFWIAFFSLVLWLILFRVHALSKKYEALKKQLKDANNRVKAD